VVQRPGIPSYEGKIIAGVISGDPDRVALTNIQPLGQVVKGSLDEADVLDLCFWYGANFPDFFFYDDDDDDDDGALSPDWKHSY
jgi:hypothetical protein